MSRVVELLDMLRAAYADAESPQEVQTEQLQASVQKEIADFVDSRLSDAAFRTQLGVRDLLITYLSKAVYSASGIMSPVLNHLLISAAPSEIQEARQFATAIAAAFEDLFDDKNRFFVYDCTETDFLALRNKNIRENLIGIGSEHVEYNIFLVRDFDGNDLAGLESALNWESQGYGGFSLLLVASDETAERIVSHADNDFRLGKYLLKNRFRFSQYDAQQVFDKFCEESERDGYTLTEDFRRALRFYITAVYPEAVYQGREFLRDLRFRIMDTRARELDFSLVLTEKDVPFSAKAERMKMEERTTAEQASVNVEEGPLPMQRQEKLLMPTPKEDASGKNVLLLALSTFPGNKILQEREFTYEIEGKTGSVTGIYQLDPVPKMLGECGIRPDHCVILYTGETDKTPEKLFEEYTDKTKAQIQPVSPKTYFTKHLRDWFGYPDNTEWITFVQTNTNEYAKAVSEATNTLRELLNDNDHVTLYLDQHGGLREISIVLSAIISLLNNEAEKLTVKTYNVEVGKNLIVSDASMKIYDFVSGINEFMNSGRISSLQNYEKHNESASLKALLEPMEQIAAGIQWNLLTPFYNGLDSLGSVIDDIGSDDAYIALFKEQIRNDYGVLLNKDERNVINILKWCCRKGFYQQALTILESKAYELLRGRYYVLKPIKKIGEGDFYAVSEDPDAKPMDEIDDVSKPNWNAGTIVFNAIINKIKPADVDEVWADQFESTFSSCSAFWELKNTIIALIKSKKTKDAKGCEINKKNRNIIQKLSELQEIKDTSIKVGIGNAALTLYMTSYDWLVFPEKQNDLFSVFLFMHKTLKQIRNNINHADEAFTIPADAILGALRFYIQLLEKLTK